MNGADERRELPAAAGTERRASDAETDRAAADRIATPVALAINAELEPAVGDRIDAYRLVRLIGAGSTGRVFEVEHERIGRRAAMKTLAASHAAHPGAIKRLFTEALAVNRINHPHIVEVTDLVENGVHVPLAPRPRGTQAPRVNAIVMELLEGQSLAQAMAEHGPLEPGRFLGILAQVCRALAAAHAAGFVHRDLKPDNIFLVNRGRDEEFVKLLDFGLTKAFGSDRSLTQTPAATMDGFFVGTPAYVSPEQAAGRPIDQRTDIYAVGVILFELICGRLPFEGPSVNEFLIQHVTVPAPSLPPDVRATKLGATLDAIVQRCLEKNPAARFSSVERLARLFQDLSRGGEIAFTGIGSYLADQQRTVRARDRNEAIRAGLGLGLGLLLALGAGAGIAHLRHKASAPVVVAAPAPTLPHLAPPPPPPPAPAQVTLLFESDPPGAEVRIVHAGTGLAEALGTTPFRRTIERGTDDVTFEIHLDGYDTMRVPTPATSDRTINVSLNRSLPARAALAKGKRNKKAKAARAAAASGDPRATDAKAARPRVRGIDETTPYAHDKTLDPFQ